MDVFPKNVTDILSFWRDEVGPDGWYRGDAALDQQIRDRFADVWNESRDGSFGLWLTDPAGCLAYVLLTDQFPRNMFRDTAKAFATDASARAAAYGAIEKDWDLELPEPERSFFYLPMMHSEDLADQERGIALIAERLPTTGAGTLEHAKVHCEIIREFGRFPYRNNALGREMIAAEQDFLDAGGYGGAFRRSQDIG